MSHAALIIGPETLDDAGVFRLDENTGLVQTLDFFPPVVDDPVWFGRIAAANALSDVYAMGGRVLTAMNIVGFPPKLPMSLLGQILRGGAEKIIEAGAALAGGHSVRDEEIKYGLSVTGIVHPDRIISNARARPGDLLVLTKPLGMGAFSTALKKGEPLDPGLVERACTVMATLNRGASEAAILAGVRTMTDVTGFGLMGHARGIAEASGVTLEFRAADLPFFERALELAEQKFISGASSKTRLFLGGHAEVGAAVPFALQQLVFDAETSGGLLICVAAERAGELLAELGRRQTPCAALVGRVLAREGEVRVRLT